MLPLRSIFCVTLYDEVNAHLPEQQAIETDVLAEIMHACIRSAEEAVITNAEYLRLLAFRIADAMPVSSGAI